MRIPTDPPYNTAEVSAKLAADKYANHHQQQQQQVQEPPAWHACSIEQKIERLRTEILNERQAKQYQYQRFARIENNLQRLDTHQHNAATGEVLISIRTADNHIFGLGSAQCASSYDPLA